MSIFNWLATWWYRFRENRKPRINTSRWNYNKDGDEL
jgi:hypothetical protein